MSFDLYTEITKQIMDMLDKGVVPWRSPIMGRGTAGHPKNLNTGKKYRGVNIFLLAFTAWAKAFTSSYWLTFNQCRERGGNVKKGEKASMVVFWKQYETEDRHTHEPTTVPVLRYYNVFNADQWEKIAQGYADGPAIEHGGAKAFWRPITDIVYLPEPTRFMTGEEYYSTLFHELAHSTGHSKRLDRKLDTEPKPFGTPDYGKEELIAEMAAAFLCGHAGIKPIVIENQAAYIQGWLKQLKNDKKLVISAASAAQKAADWVLGERNGPSQ
jgi:antirestriction protein ArdC